MCGIQKFFEVLSKLITEKLKIKNELVEKYKKRILISNKNYIPEQLNVSLEMDVIVQD